MKLTNISPSRPIASYAAVQKWVGTCIRNSRWQLRAPRVRTLKYLDLGCGNNTHENFINLEYMWHPKIDLCWDISRGIPFSNQALRGVFTEHCLEHFPLSVAQTIIQEIHRILMPGGRVRIVVPDAEMYLTRYADRVRNLTDTSLPFEQECAHDGIVEPVLAVNRIFYQDRDKLAGHWFIYDFNFLSRLLLHCGFSQTMRASFMEGGDNNLLIDSPSRAIESLYIEAVA
jgi:predicted SAM-dependent methyltransferase